MKYRTKIYLSLSGMAVFSTLLALGIVYVETKRYFFKELQSKVISVSATVAAALDPELLKQIHIKEDEGTPAYIQLRDQLRKARDLNRRKDVHVKYLYTLTPSPQDPEVLLFGVDAEESPVEVSHAGDTYPNIGKEVLNRHLDTPYSSDKFIKDQWGIWLSGFTPVYDLQGNYVATVGVDISAADVAAELNKLILFSFIALGGSLFAAFICALFLARTATISLSSLCASVSEIKEGRLNVLTRLKTGDEFGDLAKAINEMTQGLKEKERLKSSFAHYVSGHVLEKVLKSEAPANLGGQRRKVTILFSDIRNFTTLAEKLPPESVVSILNQYFEEMLEAIFTNQGTLDKFIGDGMMVEFGAPLDDLKQEKNGVLAAIAMHKNLQKMSERWAAQGKPSLEMGIGIHTGLALVGTIGSLERMQYTAIGDTVNVASRLEQASKEMNHPIIISEATFEAIKEEGFAYKKLGPLVLPGREGEVNAYAIYP